MMKACIGEGGRHSKGDSMGKGPELGKGQDNIQELKKKARGAGPLREMTEPQFLNLLNGHNGRTYFL